MGHLMKKTNLSWSRYFTKDNGNDISGNADEEIENIDQCPSQFQKCKLEKEKAVALAKKKTKEHLTNVKKKKKNLAWGQYFSRKKCFDHPYEDDKYVKDKGKIQKIAKHYSQSRKFKIKKEKETEKTIAEDRPESISKSKLIPLGDEESPEKVTAELTKEKNAVQEYGSEMLLQHKVKDVNQIQAKLNHDKKKIVNHMESFSKPKVIAEDEAESPGKKNLKFHGPPNGAITSPNRRRR